MSQWAICKTIIFGAKNVGLLLQELDTQGHVTVAILFMEELSIESKAIECGHNEHNSFSLTTEKYGKN